MFDRLSLQQSLNNRLDDPADGLQVVDLGALIKSVLIWKARVDFDTELLLSSRGA
jgi:hypothetical protein